MDPRRWHHHGDVGHLEPTGIPVCSCPDQERLGLGTEREDFALTVLKWKKNLNRLITGHYRQKQKANERSKAVIISCENECFPGPISRNFLAEAGFQSAEKARKRHASSRRNSH